MMCQPDGKKVPVKRIPVYGAIIPAADAEMVRKILEAFARKRREGEDD